MPKTIIHTLRAAGHKTADIAARCGVSIRTVHGWAQGRAISGPAKIILEQIAREGREGSDGRQKQ